MTNERFTVFYGGPFSNWFRRDFNVDGRRYAHVEQFMMVGKARLFGDAASEAKIMREPDPLRCKRLGRAVRGYRQEVWDGKARDIVYAGCYAKFEQNPALLKELQKTGGTTLVEASPTDQIWGVGLSESDPKARDRRYWRGTNWLGEVLTLVREDLEQGFCRTDNFCWSGTPSVVGDVRVVNETDHELYISDHDWMRRGACDLKHDFEGVSDVDVTFRELGDKKLHYFEVEVALTRAGERLSEKGTARDNAMAAWASAAQRMRTRLESQAGG